MNFVTLESDVPRITKLSHAIIQQRTNHVLLEWTTVQNAESYNVFYKVKGTTFQIPPTSDTSFILENIDGNDTTVLWITAIQDGKEGLPSASVTVPIVSCKIAFSNKLRVINDMHYVCMFLINHNICI